MMMMCRHTHTMDRCISRYPRNESSETQGCKMPHARVVRGPGGTLGGSTEEPRDRGKTPMHATSTSPTLFLVFLVFWFFGVLLLSFHS